MTIEAFRALSAQDREDIFRVRYSIYVEEMGRYNRIADHEGRRLVEPEDAHSVLFGARVNGQLVATGRLTYGVDGFSARQIDQYSLAPFLAEIPVERMAVGERFMVAAPHRGTEVGPALRALEVQDLEARDIRILFGDCEPHLLSLNLSRGGLTYAKRNINSEEAGYLIPLLLFPQGTEGLAEALGHRDDEGRPALPPSLESAMLGGSVQASTLTASEEYWDKVHAALEGLDKEELHAFAGFEDAEVKLCIARSNIIECSPGDRVLKEGGTARNLYVVLDGTLEVRHKGRFLNVLGRGDVFGDMAFLLGVPRQSDVYAATPGVRILSLSDGGLRELMASDASVAAKFLLNLSRMLCGRLVRANSMVQVEHGLKAVDHLPRSEPWS